MLREGLLLLLLPACLCVVVLEDDNWVHPTCLVCNCNCTAYTVNCSHKMNLTIIPEDPCNGTRVLNMSFTRLRSINESGLNTYSSLQVLDLSSASLEDISDTAFSNLIKLKSLNLSNNEHLPMTQNKTSPDLFHQLTSLTELKIYGNTGTYNLDGYPNEALKKIPNLQSLWIDGLTNASFGRDFQDMTSLKVIRIPGDIIQPPWRFCETNIQNKMLKNLIHVTNFTMRKCGVRCVESDAFKYMSSLVYLDLSLNRFLTIYHMSMAAPSLAYTKLTVLILNAIENVIQLTCGPTITKEIAKNFSNITTLKELHVEYNAINGFERHAMEYLPKSIEYINAKRNEFELGFYTFDAYQLENLTTLDISYNFFPDDTEIWHNNPRQTHQETAISLTNACDNLPIGTKTELESKTDQLIDPFERRTDFKSASEYAVIYDIDVNNSLRKTDRDTYLNPEKSFINILKDTPPTRKPDLSQHLIELFNMNARSNQESFKLYNDKEAEKRERVCPQTKPDIPPGTVVAYLPAKLEIIDLSHSKLAHPIPELYFNETNSIKQVIASNSLLYCWDGPIHGLTKLEYVDLSLNLCSNVSPSFFDEVPNLKNLSIAKNFLFDPVKNDEDGRLLSKLTKLEYLNISYNRLQVVPAQFLINQAKLRQLDLSENMLVKFNVALSHMIQLDTIDLRHNFIHTLSKKIRNDLTRISERNYKTTRKPLYVNLKENDVLCFCNNLDFLQWVHDHMSTCRFLDISLSQCVYYNLTSTSIYNRNDFGEILGHLKRHCASYTSVIVGVSVALCLLLNIGIGVAVHRFRWKIRYWYYVAPSKQITRSGYISIDSLSTFGSRYKYDIFVASTTDDRTFVMEKMKSRLENERFRLFIQDNDIVPGQNIYSMIANAIHVSRAVIFVISEGCENDKEWMIAMRMAHEESLKRGQPVFFGIFIDHEPGTPYTSDVREIRRRSYVDYPGDAQPANEQTFWSEISEKISETGNSEILTIELGIQ